jgi:hypothetical protein
VPGKPVLHDVARACSVETVELHQAKSLMDHAECQLTLREMDQEHMYPQWQNQFSASVGVIARSPDPNSTNRCWLLMALV